MQSEQQQLCSSHRLHIGIAAITVLYHDMFMMPNHKRDQYTQKTQLWTLDCFVSASYRLPQDYATCLALPASTRPRYTVYGGLETIMHAFHPSSRIAATPCI